MGYGSSIGYNDLGGVGPGLRGSGVPWERRLHPRVCHAMAVVLPLLLPCPRYLRERAEGPLLLASWGTEQAALGMKGNWIEINPLNNYTHPPALTPHQLVPTGGQWGWASALILGPHPRPLPLPEIPLGAPTSTPLEYF